MIYGLIKKNTYQDSVNLMLLSSKLSSLEGINNVSIMMGTPANKDIFKSTGMYASEFEEAGPNDICIGIDTDDASRVQGLADELDISIKELSAKSNGSKLSVSRTLDGALNNLPDANLALISLPGEYVFKEADRLLDKNINTFIFSDNVSIEDEKKLKEKAHSKGLIVMGPDCGTGIISNIPLAFANVIPKGNIGIVGASGTGIQEVTSVIGRKGGGISHAIGIGGRDLSEEIGGISAIDALKMLNEDENTDVIVFISKPPAPSVKEKVIETFKTLDKKVVALFLGEKPGKAEDNINYVWTLEEAGYQALILAKSFGSHRGNLQDVLGKLDIIKNNTNQRKIHGYYGGGTLAGEAAILLKDYFDIHDSKDPEGYMLDFEGHEIIDFGDDKYTKGRPHPMIDPSTKIAAIEKLIGKEDVAIVLIDNVLGYGSHADMAGSLAPSIKKVIEDRQSKGKDILFIASICGTEEDTQVYSEQVNKLEEVGVLVLDTNAEATFTAIEALKYLDSKGENTVSNSNTFLKDELKIINMGLESFANTVISHGGQVVQYNWTPIAGGDVRMQKLLDKLNSL